MIEGLRRQTRDAGPNKSEGLQQEVPLCLLLRGKREEVGHWRPRVSGTGVMENSLCWQGHHPVEAEEKHPGFSLLSVFPSDGLPRLPLQLRAVRIKLIKRKLRDGQLHGAATPDLRVVAECKENGERHPVPNRPRAGA